MGTCALNGIFKNLEMEDTEKPLSRNFMVSEEAQAKKFRV